LAPEIAAEHYPATANGSPGNESGEAGPGMGATTAAGAANHAVKASSSERGSLEQVGYEGPA